MEGRKESVLSRRLKELALRFSPAVAPSLVSTPLSLTDLTLGTWGQSEGWAIITVLHTNLPHNSQELLGQENLLLQQGLLVVTQDVIKWNKRSELAVVCCFTIRLCGCPAPMAELKDGQRILFLASGSL